MRVREAEQQQQLDAEREDGIRSQENISQSQADVMASSAVRSRDWPAAT
jgi:transposase-like protein